MKRIITVIYLVACSIVFLYGSETQSELLEHFVDWESGKPDTTGLIKYSKVKDVLTPATVEPDKYDDTFTSGIYEYSINDSDLVALVDTDFDGVDEAFVLLLQGSGRFPVFYGFKKSSATSKYRRVMTEDKNIQPAVLGGDVYFIESFREFNSGRWPFHNILTLSSDMKFSIIARITTKYSYVLSADVEQYVNSDEINKIAEQDYSFIGIDEKRPTDFSLEMDKNSIQAHIRWTSVGYYPTTINLKIANQSGIEKKIDGLWGFSIKKVRDIPFLCTISMDDQHRIAGIQDFRITIYRLTDWEIIVSEYIVATKSYIIE